MPRSLVAQEESRRLMEAVVAPWLVTRWDQNDFGIDGVVEITSAIAQSTDRAATGRLFAVQLKATDDDEDRTSLRITTVHLRYWLNHSLPVLLVSAHLPTGTMRAPWIDVELYAQLREKIPTLWMQQTVTIPLSDVLAPASRESLETSVLRFRKRDVAVSPLRFFELRNAVLAAAEKLDDLGKRSGVRSVEFLVGETRAALRAVAYTIAVAGPQRVGESTLINALLGVEVSPVADYPTTAVPLVFEPGDQPKAIVALADGSQMEVEATAEALRPFAAQQENDANEKNVRAVRVVLPNDMLARGVQLADTPGLHDASKAVRDATEEALHHADAALYVLDASLGGKFKLGHAEVEDLRRLQSSKERVLVVLNQADAFTPEQRRPLLAYIEKVLRREGVWSGLPAPPMFVSAKLA